MKKITQTEFKKWSEEFKVILNEIINDPNSSYFTNETERTQCAKIFTLINIYAERGNILAIFTGLVCLEAPDIRRDKKPAILGGLTLDEWSSRITQRLKEHCITNGYYKPNSSLDLTLLKTRRQKVNRVLKDPNQFSKLLVNANSEDYRIITDNVNFYKEGDRIFGVNDSNRTEGNDIDPKFAFFFEDYVGRVERLLNKLEADNSPNSIPTPQYQSNLETEIERLQTQVRQLEKKVNESDNPTSKEVYLDLLNSVKKDLENKNNEKNKLSSEKSPPKSNSNDNKLNLAIGLAIIAIVIGFICVILITNKRKER